MCEKLLAPWSLASRNGSVAHASRRLEWIGPALVIASPIAGQQGGRAVFESRCARCHGADGAGGERGPDILHSRTARARSEQSLRDLLRTRIPAAGMPAFTPPQVELNAVASYVRALIAPAPAPP